MSNYLTLLAQRADLDKQIEIARKASLTSAWSDINKVMAVYSLTKEAVAKHYSGKSVKVSKKTAPVKYQIGDVSWSGRGICPRQFKVALQVNPGQSIEDYRVKSSKQEA